MTGNIHSSGSFGKQKVLPAVLLIFFFSPSSSSSSKVVYAGQSFVEVEGEDFEDPNSKPKL